MKFLKFTLNHSDFKEIKFLFLSFFFLLFSNVLKAQWSKYPVMNSPVCTETDEQTNPNMVSDGAGGTIITWSDKRNTKEYDIYAQRLDAFGNELWTSGGVIVNNYSGDQTLPIITTDNNGGAIVSWLDSRNSVAEFYAQRIDASGSMLWNTDGIVLVSNTGNRSNCRISTDNNGGAIIVWEDYRSSTTDIYAQRVDDGGNVLWGGTGGAVVCQAGGDQHFPSICSQGDTVFMAWEDARNSKKAPTFDIYAQALDMKGNAYWTTDGIAICNFPGEQNATEIISDDSAGVIITWHDLRNSTSLDIYAQRVEPSGTVLWTTDGVPVCTASNGQMFPKLTKDGFKGAIITWLDGRTAGNTYIYAQRISFNGTPLWTSNGVDICTVTGSSRENPVIISDNTNGAIIAWSDDRNTTYDIFAQKINTNGAIQWLSNGVLVSSATGDQLGCAMMPDGLGGAFFSWVDSRGSDNDIYSQNILSEGSLGNVPEINVQGNYITISSGDITPSKNDNTDFGSVSSSTPITKSFMIFNTGNKVLTITNIQTTGANSSEFVPQTTNFPFGIDPLDSFSFDVVFTPTVVGVRGATLNIHNNDSNEAVYNFLLKGIFKAAEIDIKGNGVSILSGDNTPDPSDSTSFGNTRVNTAMTRTFFIVSAGTDTLKISGINISGTNNAEFTIPKIILPRLLGPNKTMFIPITFLPTATGIRKATITILNNDPDESAYSFDIQGMSTAPKIGVKGNSVSIADGDNSPSTTDNTDFGKVNILNAGSGKFKIFNTGSDALNISSISVAGTNSADFSVQNLTYPQSIPVGDSLEFETTFTPIDLGVRTAEINIASDDNNAALFNFTIKGTTISQEIGVKGNTQVISIGDNTPSTSDNTDFGSVNKNANKTNRFYILNQGTDVLMVTGVSLSGTDASMFSMGALTPGSSIPVGDSSYFDVTFNPNNNGLKQAIVTVSNNDPDEGNYLFAIQGLSVSPIIQVNGNNVPINDGNTTVSVANNTNFGSVEIPNSILKSYKITNNGNVVLTINNITMTGLNAIEFSIQPIVFPKNIGIGESLSFDINFTPADSGIRKAIVNISSNDPDIANFDFAVEGTATRKIVGFSKIGWSDVISLYPNPANTEVFVTLPVGISAEIQILSTDGRVVWYKGLGTEGSNNIDVSGLASGVYMVRTDFNGISVNKKLIINR